MTFEKEIQKILKELKEKIPSYYIVPVQSEEEKKLMDENGILGALVIQDGKYKDHTIIIRDIEIDNKNCIIDFSSVDANKNNVESEELNKIVGDLVVYILLSSSLETYEKDNKND